MCVGGVMKSKLYLEFIHSKACLITGTTPVDAHHSKAIIRTGVRPPDYFCVPLERKLHLYDLHESNESEFWQRHDIDILETVIQLNIEFIEKYGRDKGYASMFKTLRKSAGFNQYAHDKVDELERHLFSV
jgi:hypothetical protein